MSDEAIVSFASLVARFTSIGIDDDGCARELGYHGASLSCTVSVVDDPHGATRVATAADNAGLDKQLTFHSPLVHCNAELSPEQRSQSYYTPLVFIGPSGRERRRQAAEQAERPATTSIDAAQALVEAKKELAEAEGQPLPPAVPASQVEKSGQAQTLPPLEPTFALNVSVFLEKSTGGRKSRAHITTHQSTFAATTLAAQDASARFNFTRGELVAAMKELLGSAMASARGGSLDGEDAGMPAAASNPLAGSVALSAFVVSLCPMVRMLCSVPETLTIGSNVQGEAAAAVPMPWRIELADEAEADRTMAEQDASATVTQCKRSREQLLDYGAIPLLELHRHFRLFFDLLRRSVTRARSDAAPPSQGSPLSSVPALLTASPCASLRWELLRDLDLSRLVLGDKRLVPVLAVLSVASSLRYFNADRNELTLVSAKRLFVVLSTTPHRLERLSVAYNNFLESSGEELLRIIRHCRFLWRVDCEGNSFTPRLAERIQRSVELNVSQLQADPYYLLGSQWAYLTSWECMPAEALFAVKSVWTMLVVGAGRPFDEARRAAAEKDDANGSLVIATSGEAAQKSSSPSTGLYPLEVVAPLLSQVARLVAHNMYKITSDPGVRQVFSPISAHDSDEERTVVYSTSYYKLLTVAMRCIVETPQRWEAAAAVLAATGAAHERCGVSHLLYPLANKFFVEAVATLCGDEVFTTAHKAGLVQFLALVSRTALQGTEAFA